MQRSKNEVKVDDKRNRRWYKDVRSSRSSISRFLHTQKQSLLTGGLLVVIVMLLFGIFSQFQPPPTSTPPDGVTVIDYTAFVRQVKAGNVLAVIIQGNAVHGLLALPFSANATLVTRSSRNDAADIAEWTRNVNAGYLSQGYTSAEGYPAQSKVRARASQQSKALSPPLIDSRRAIYTYIPGSGDASLMPLLLNSHVMVSIRPIVQSASWLWPLLDGILLMVLALLLPSVLSPRTPMRSSAFPSDRLGQMGRIRTRHSEHGKETKKPQNTSGKSSAASLVPEEAPGNVEPSVTFAEVAGIDEVRAELEEIVQFLRCPERFSRLGAHIPRGALLVGPPGTGKTLLAKAVAGQAGVPFFSMSASEFVEMFVGIGARRVRDLFDRARQSAPCVIFLDELDAVGRKRSMSITGNDERDQTLNQLLVELDGFDSRQAIVVLAATNRADILDQALLRPGRFDRQITLSLPDRVGREAILKVHTRRTPLHQDVSLERLSRLTTGMSGAGLANLVNEAALLAARHDLEHIPQECFEEALARVQLGALRPVVMSEADRRIIAYHEGGHALVAYHLPQADTVNRVTILPRGQSLGVTQFTAEEDRYNSSRETLLARIAVGLGGRAAEELAFGSEHVTTGAENDLQMVTDLARRMVTRWGMSEQIGVFCPNYEPHEMSLNMRRIDIDTMQKQALSLVADADARLLLNGANRHRLGRQYTSAISTSAPRNSSTTMATLIDHEVQHILNEGYARAHALLSEHYDQLTKLADALLEHEQLDRAQFEALVLETTPVEDCK